jgi:hypothetical protein
VTSTVHKKISLVNIDNVLENEYLPYVPPYMQAVEAGYLGFLDTPEEI